MICCYNYVVTFFNDITMNITNLEKEVTQFIENNTDSKVLNSQFIRGNLYEHFNPITNETELELSNDCIQLILDKSFEFNDDIAEFEIYLYSSYRGLMLDYVTNAV